MYDIGYAYDKLGNRMWRYSYLTYPTVYTSTQYHYDVHLTPQSMTYPTKNNRLVRYEEYGRNDQGARLLRTVHYGYFSKTGHVANITIDDAGEGTIHDLYLVYTEHGRLWQAIRQELTQYPPVIAEDVDPKEAWEFRYDSGRQRYVAKHWTIEIVGGFPEFTEVGDPVWTDYLGQQPYVDYTLDGVTVYEQTRYLAGAGVHAQQEVDNVTDPITYLHGDLTRSTMLTTDDAAGQPRRAIYTAFGEPVTYDQQAGWRVGFPADIGTRYGYDGGWGYESGLITLWGEDTDLPPVTLQHVGERWYQPGIGRFVQRDPIGLVGGMNVYAYVDGSPLQRTDSSGMGFLLDLAWEVAKRVPVVIKKASQQAAGKPGPGLHTGVIMPFVSAVNAAPDLVRICVAAGHRRKLLEGDVCDLDDNSLDNYERGHGTNVKPRTDFDDFDWSLFD